MSNIPEWTSGDRLAKARRSAGLDQQEMSERLGLSRATVVALERDKRPVRRQTYIAWALTCGVDLEWLETGQEGKASGGAEEDLGDTEWHDAKAARRHLHSSHSYLLVSRARRYCPKVQVALVDA